MGDDIDVAGCVPAQPGYYVLSTAGGSDGDPVVADQEPVVAWVIDRSFHFYTPHPITQGGIKVDAPVLRPDGTVAIGGSSFWTDVTDWLEEKLEELAIQRKQERYEATLKKNGVTVKVAQVDKPANVISPGMAAINAALEAARTGKVRP